MEFKTTTFQDSRHMKVVSLSALSTGRFYPTGNIPGTHFCYRLSQPQGHSSAGRIVLKKNKKVSVSSMLHEANVAYYAFDIAPKFLILLFMPLLWLR